MKRLSQVILAVFAVGFSSSVLANQWGPASNIQNSSDIVRTADGASCEQSLSTGKHTEVGSFKVDNSSGVYVRMVFQLGKKKSSIDCSRMYNLEVQRMELELDELRAKIKLLEQGDTPTLESDWE